MLFWKNPKMETVKRLLDARGLGEEECLGGHGESSLGHKLLCVTLYW